MKTIIVTGASRGIGRAIVQRLVREAPEFGTVCITATSQERINPVAEELSTPNIRIIPRALNLSSESSIQEFVSFVGSELGRFDVLINNGAIMHKGENLSAAALQETFNVNLYGTVKLTQGLLPLVAPESHIIMVSSRWGNMNLITNSALNREILSPNLTLDDIFNIAERYQEAARQRSLNGWNSNPYGMSKTLLNSYVRVLDRDTPPAIRVNSLCPGWVRTDMGGSSAPKSPAQGADTPVFLAKDNSGQSGKFWAEKKVINW